MHIKVNLSRNNAERDTRELVFNFLFLNIVARNTKLLAAPFVNDSL